MPSSRVRRRPSTRRPAATACAARLARPPCLARPPSPHPPPPPQRGARPVRLVRHRHGRGVDLGGQCIYPVFDTVLEYAPLFEQAAVEAAEAAAEAAAAAAVEGRQPRAQQGGTVEDEQGSVEEDAQMGDDFGALFDSDGDDSDDGGRSEPSCAWRGAELVRAVAPEPEAERRGWREVGAEGGGGGAPTAPLVEAAATDWQNAALRDWVLQRGACD
eukprot:SAG11_NODE_154_length_14340_cov_19.803946_1_plen_216_part_00